MLQDEDGLDTSPWFVRAFVRVGMPTAFAAALLWFLMTNITGAMTTVQGSQAEVLKLSAVTVQNQSVIIALLQNSNQDQRRQAYVLQAMCLNAAKTLEERDRCSTALLKLDK